MNLINKIFYLKNKKRSNILINPEFQLSIINYVAVLFLVVTFIFFLLNVTFYYILKQKGIDAGLLPSSEYFIFLNKAAKLMSIAFFAVSFVVVFIIYFFGLRLSHRIAGPIYKINTTLDKMLESHTFHEIKLRKNDY